MYAAYSQIKFDVRKERPMTDPMLHIEEVMEMTGLSRATIYRKMRKGQFPKPLKLGIAPCVGVNLRLRTGWRRFPALRGDVGQNRQSA